jgi:long-subunit fatty acid transport protein
MIGLLMKRKRCGFIILLLILLCLPRDGAAALFEQLAVDSRSGALANSVTADPQGPMSIHFNPAGLDRVRGTEFDMGLFYVPVLNNQGHFTQGTDPKTHQPWAPFGGWFNNGVDPEAGHDSSTSPSVSLPFVGKLPFMVGPYNGIAHHDKDSPFAYGIAVYAPFAVGLEHKDPDDPYRFLGASQSIVRMVISPGMSYRLTNNLSIGASFGWGLSFMGFNTRMRAPNDMVALTGALGEATKGLEIPIISELTFPAPWFGGGLSPYEELGGLKFFAQDAFNTSYNFGVLWEPYSWLSFGGVYQSKAEADMKGKYRFDYSTRMQKTINWLHSSPLTIIIAAMLGLPTSCPAEEYGNMSIDIVFPQRVQIGMKLQPIPRVKFLVDANWTEWSAWKSTQIVFDHDMKQLQMARLMGYQGGPRNLIMVNNFKDTWHLTYGLELQPFHPVTLRFGYEFRPSSIQDNLFGPIPLADMKLYSVGLGVDLPVPARKFKDLHGFMDQLQHPDHIDLGFTYMTSETTVNFNQSKLFNSTDFTGIIYNPFAGLVYQQKTTSYIISLNQVFLF